MNQNVNFQEFLHRLKGLSANQMSVEWEESQMTDDHGLMVLGARDLKPQFSEVEVKNERG